jgi:hypothetical protein
MENDPPGGVPGLTRVGYHLYELRLDAVEPGVGGAPDTQLLRLKLDALDPNLTLHFSGTEGNPFLLPRLSSNPLFVATVAVNNLPGCPMVPHINTFNASCDRAVEVLATLLLRAPTLALMQELLSQYPAPQFYDSQGRSIAPAQIRPVSSYKDSNRITLYGKLPQ